MSSALSPRIHDRIFVVGAPRSGTTLAQSLLAAHSATTSFTESHLFARHFAHIPLLARPILVRSPAPGLRAFLAENDEEPPAAAAWFDATGGWALRAKPLLPFQTRSVARRLLRVLDELALRRGRSRWIEKTPRHLRYVPFLEDVAGPAGCRFVHVIRDGLEVVASLREASRGWERAYDLETCIRRWNADVGISLSRIDAPRDHFLFYEELTSWPEATLRRLLDGMGLGWEPQILERYADVAKRLVSAPEAAWKEDVGRGIQRSTTSHRALTADERRRAVRSLRRDLYDRLRRRAARRFGETGDSD